MEAEREETEEEGWDEPVFDDEKEDLFSKYQTLILFFCVLATAFLFSNTYSQNPLQSLPLHISLFFDHISALISSFFIQTMDSTCYTLSSLFGWDENEMMICSFKTFLQKTSSLIFTMWDLFFLPLSIFNEWLGVDTDFVWKSSDVCPYAGAIKIWGKDVIMKLSHRFGAKELAIRNLNIIAEFITTNFFLFLCSFELNSSILFRLFVPTEGSVSLSEGLKTFIGFDGNFVVSYIIRSLFLVSVFLWAIVCKFTVGPFLRYSRKFWTMVVRSFKKSRNQDLAKKIRRIWGVDMIINLIFVVIQVLQLFSTVLYIVTFGWINMTNLILTVIFMELASTLWFGFQMYYFWDEAVHNTNERVQQFADILFERAANLSINDLERFRVAPSPYQDQRFLQ